MSDWGEKRERRVASRIDDIFAEVVHARGKTPCTPEGCWKAVAHAVTAQREANGLKTNKKLVRVWEQYGERDEWGRMRR